MNERTRDSVLEDIKRNPQNYRHFNMNELTMCCFVGNAIDLSLMDAHAKFVDLGENGGRECDIVEGPCNCGAWHFIDKDGKRK